MFKEFILINAWKALTIKQRQFLWSDISFDKEIILNLKSICKIKADYSMFKLYLRILQYQSQQLDAHTYISFLYISKI